MNHGRRVKDRRYFFTTNIQPARIATEDNLVCGHRFFFPWLPLSAPERLHQLCHLRPAFRDFLVPAELERPLVLFQSG